MGNTSREFPNCHHLKPLFYRSGSILGEVIIPKHAKDVRAPEGA